MRILFAASALLLAASTLTAQAAPNLSGLRAPADGSAIVQVREASEGPRREDRRADRQADRQAGRQADRQADRRADRQADRRADRRTP